MNKLLKLLITPNCLGGFKDSQIRAFSLYPYNYHEIYKYLRNVLPKQIDGIPVTKQDIINTIKEIYE